MSVISFFSNFYKNRYLLSKYSILPRIVRGFFRGLVLNKPTLKTIELFPTFKCNSECIMCSIDKYPTNAREALEINEYAKIAIQAKSLNVIAFSILGGEPTLRKDLEDIVRALNPDDFFIIVVTNCLNLTRERLISLKEAGISSIGLSLDSADREKNDYIRGHKGHYDKVITVMDWCREIGLHVTLTSVAFHGELDEFRRILEFAKERGVVVGGGAVGYVGRADTRDDLLLDEEENATLRRWLKEYPFLRFDWSLSYKFRHECPAGKEKIGITDMGEVIACSMNPLSFGNVRKEPLTDIWKRMNKFPEYEKSFAGCLVAEDTDYIDKYLRPIANVERNPVFYKDHPSLRE